MLMTNNASALPAAQREDSHRRAAHNGPATHSTNRPVVPQRFSASHPHKENCVQLINHAFKRINDRNAIIPLTKDNGRSIDVLFTGKSSRRAQNIRCV